MATEIGQVTPSVDELAQRAHDLATRAARLCEAIQFANQQCEQNRKAQAQLAATED